MDVVGVSARPNHKLTHAVEVAGGGGVGRLGAHMARIWDKQPAMLIATRPSPNKAGNYST